MFGSSSTNSTLGVLIMLDLSKPGGGQLDAEAGEVAFGALDRDRPAVFADDAEAEAEAEARPAGGPPRREERVEDLVDVLAPDADARVVNLDLDRRAARPLDGARLRAEQLLARRLRAQRVVRVAHHVDHHLPEARAVGLDGRQVLFDIGLDRDAVLPELVAEERERG